ncbi:MAG: hypothetical protein ACK6EB_04080, partial [Planctomyces sp.]
LAGTNVTGLTVSTPANSSGSVTVSQLTATKVGVIEVQSITINPSQIPEPVIRTTVTQISNGAPGSSHVQEIVINKPGSPTPTVSAIVTETIDGYTSTSQIRQLTIRKPVQTKPEVTTSVTEVSRGVSASNERQQITLTRQTPTTPEIKATVTEVTPGKTASGTVTGLTIFAANAASGTYSLSHGGKSETIIWSQNDVINNSRKLRNALQKLTGVSDVSVKFDQRTITTEQRHAIRIPGFTGIITAQDLTLGATFHFDTSGNSPAGLNEVQQVALATAAASGTFRLSLPYNGRTYSTVALSLAATAASIQTAMNAALTGAGTVNVTRTGTADGFSLNITFTGNLGSRNLDLLKVEAVADPPVAGGTFTLSFGGQTTPAIAMNSNTEMQATDIQTALRSLSSIGAGNVQVTYDSAPASAAPQYNVTFIGSLAAADVGPVTASDLQLQYASVQSRTVENGKAASNEKQVVTLDSGSADGTFRLSLTVNGRLYTTADLAFNATGSSIQSAFNTALGAAGNVSVSRPGTSGSSTFDVTFSGALAGKDIAPLMIHTDVVTPKAGGSFTLSYAGQTTAAISLADSPSAQASQIQQALESLSTIGAGNVSVQYDDTSTDAATAPRFLVTSGTISVENISTSGANLTHGSSITPTTISGPSTTVSEVQTVALDTGTASGTFTLGVKYNGSTLTTSALAFDATEATIQSALNTAINSIGSATVSRTGSSGAATLTVTFGGNLSGRNIQPVTVTTSTTVKTASGSFTLTYGGQTTRAINLVNGNTVQASLIQIELERLSNIGTGNVEVTWDSTSTAQQPRFRVALKGALTAAVASTFMVQGVGLSNASISTSTLTTGRAVGHEVQRILMNVGTETGTYNLVVPVGSNVYQTTALSFTASSSAIQSALNTALAGVSGTTIITAISSNGQLQLDVTFGGALAGLDLGPVSVLTQANAPSASGAFTLSYDGETTGSIAYTSDTTTQAANIQAALLSLSNIGAGNVSVLFDTTATVSGTRYLVTFTGDLANTDVPQISAAYPELAHATITAGTGTPGKAGDGETQRIRILTTGNESTFTLSVVVNGTTYTTTAISTSAGKDEVQTALSTAISAASGATITVTYWSGTELQVRFGGTLAETDVPTITGTATSSVSAAVLTQTVEGFSQPAVPASSTILVVDYAAHPVTVATGTGSSISLTLDGSRGELTEASATVRLRIKVYILASGILKVEKTHQEDVDLLGDAVLVDVDLLQIQLQDVSLFVGTGGVFDAASNDIDTTDATGLHVDTAALNIGIATVTNQTPEDPPTDKRKWTGIAASADGLSIVGLPDDYTIEANNLSIVSNSASNGTQIAPKIDWSVLFTDDAHPLHDLADDTSFSVGGGMTLNLKGYVMATGHFTVEKTQQEEVDLLGDEVLVDVDLLQIQLQDVSLFVGTGGVFDSTTNDIVTTDATGFFVDNAALHIAIATVTDPTPEDPPTDKRKWTGIAASAGRMEIVGLPEEFVIRVEDLSVTSNTAKNGTEAGTPISWSTLIDDTDNPLHDVAGEKTLEVTGRLTLFLSDFVQLQGDFGLSKSSDVEVKLAGSTTKKTVNVLTLGLNNLDVFVGDGPYFVDSNNDDTIDEQDTPSGDATGLLLKDVSIAVGIFRPVEGSGRYYAVSARCEDIDLLGIETSGSDAFQLTATGYRLEVNGGSTGGSSPQPVAIDFSDAPVTVPTSGSADVTFNYSSALQRVAIEHATLAISDYVYVSGGFAFTRQKNMSVTLNDVPATTKTVNALVFGAGNVDLFVGSGPYFEDTDDDGDIDDLDTRNPDAIGLAMENGNFAYMVMTPTAGTGAKPKYKALKATADRIELVGIDAFTLSATDLVVEYNSVSNPSNPDDTTVVDFTKMAGGHYTADTGYGTLEFDYSSKLLSAEVGEADLQIASNVFIRGGLAFSKGSPQIVKMSDGTTKTVSGFEIGANDLSVFVGTNGPYWLNATGTEINSKAVGVALENTDVAVTVLKPTAPSDKVKYIGLKANSSFFGFVGIDAFQLEASSIVVDLNLASGGGSTSASPVIDFDATFNEQRTVFDTNDNGIVTVGELRALSGETSFEGLYTTEDLDGKSVSYKTLLAALDTGDGTGTTPDGLLQIAEVAAFLSSAHDSLATTSDANNNGRLDVGYEIRMGGESAFLHEQQRRIHAAADDVLLNISEFVYINANMAIDIGARETITVNSGISSYVAGLLPDGSVDFLNGLLSEFRTQLNNAETTLNNAFESVVTEVQQQVDNVIDQVADKIVEQIQSTLAEAKASVSTLVTAQLSSGTSGLSDLLLTPILDDLTGELLDAVPEGTLRDMVNTIIVEPVESLLKTAFDNLLKEALQDSVDQLVAAVSDALTAGVGKSAEKLKAAIQKAMEPQIARITVKLNGLIAQVQNKLAPVLEKLEGIANLTIGDDFKTIGGLEAEVTAIGISDANAFIGLPPSEGLDFSQPIADQDGIGIFVQNFNMGLAIFKPVLSKQLPTFTAAKITADAAGFTDGGADLLVMTIRDLEVELNLGKPLLNVGPLLGTATIDFERSFPADPGGNSGYVVETGTTSDPITLDFTQERILASVSNVTIQVAEFVYISGSIAFEKGAVRTVKVAPGLSTDAAQAFLDELNLPDNLSIPATGATETELSFMTVGGSDLQAF